MVPITMFAPALFLYAIPFALGRRYVPGDILRRAVVNQTRSLAVPQSPPPGKLVVDGNFQSYSIEFSYMLDYAGNNS
jgi:hypothetical protein